MVTSVATSRYTHDRRSILGVEVFSVGKHIPSNGPEIEVTTNDLDAIVDAFNNGTPEMVPVKFGHTSDAFNIAQAAELLGVTEGLITGEGNEGDGAILPGTVTKLTRVQNKLLADFDVIAPVAPMIADSLLKGISIEITGNVLSAVTLLGAERPAVKDLVPLQAATVLKEGAIYAFVMGTANATVIPRKFHTHVERMRSISWFAMDLGLAEGATIDDVIARLQQLNDHEEDESRRSPMDEKGIRALLSIDDAADIEVAVEALKDKAIEASKPSFAERVRSYFKLGKDVSEEEVIAKLEGHPGPDPQAMSAFSEEVKSLLKEKGEEIDTLKHENSVRKYASQCLNFKAIQGTPEELGEKLAILEEKMGSDAVSERLKEWEIAQNYFKEAGISVAVGNRGDGTPNDWEAVLTKWKEDHPREKGQTAREHDRDAIKAVSEASPSLFREQYRANRKDAAMVRDEA